MASVTALELMNRVMLFRRQPPISAYQSTNPEHVATLNALNMAKEDILGTRRWEFDLRTDGQLVTKASASSRGITPDFSTTAGSSTGTIVYATEDAATEILGDWVARVIPTGSADYSNTAIRLASATTSASTAVAVLPFNAPVTLAAVDCDVIYAEYLLPDTVREVVRASYEQQDVRLEQVGATVEVTEVMPNLYTETGEPRLLAVGGFDRNTYSTSGAVPAPRLRAIVGPVPDNEYILTYSYYYAHPDFTSGTSSLVGVPPAVVNDIVWQAVSVMSMAWDNNYAAAHFADMAQAQANAKNASYSGGAARRHTVRSWDSGRSQNMFDESWQTKTIGNG